MSVLTIPHRARFAAISIAFSLFSAPLAAESPVATPKQRYAEAVSYQQTAPEKTIAMLQALVDEGNARAMDRLAYLTFKGVGTQADVAKSIDLYRQAVAADRTSSLVSLGKVYMTSGAHQPAIEALSKASEFGHVKAEAVLAWAHATGRFGDLSNQGAGLKALADLAATDQREAQMYLLDAAVRRKSTPANINTVLDRLHLRHADGDAKAAEALLRYYRAQKHPRGSLDTRAELLQTAGLRDKIRVEEGLYLAAARQPRQFWTVSEDLVQSAPADVYARGLVVAARINRNAYVRIVQKELRQHGYAVGRASPYMNAPLIRAINRFCRDTGLNEACRLGPLKSATIKAVAGKLAEMRRAT